MGKPLLWGLASGLACFVGIGSFLNLTSGPISLIFQTLSFTIINTIVGNVISFIFVFLEKYICLHYIFIFLFL